MQSKKHLEISPEIEHALRRGKPVVALESTIISHGMPYPRNVETALLVEQVVRDNGAVPATIAIINGKMRVGLAKEEIDYLGRKGLMVVKTSRRDIPVILSRKEDGATTVAATMIIANLAGIGVFATGGIGGVHRGAETTMDVSADLEELAATPVLVVCAGAKSILDLGLTREYLETKGVVVIGFQTDELPAFYTRASGHPVDFRMDTPAEIASAFHIKRQVGLGGGMVVANPIEEEYALDSGYINDSIERATAEAKSLGIKGKEITPYLLDKIQKITEGKSLEANIRLVCGNAALAAKIASELCRQEQ